MLFQKIVKAMFSQKNITFDKKNGNAWLELTGIADSYGNDKKIVKLFELLIPNFHIEIDFDVPKKDLTLCDEISEINGIVIIQTQKIEKRSWHRVTMEMTLDSNGLSELIQLIVRHDNRFEFKCMSNGVFGGINDNDGSFIQVPKLTFEKNKEIIEAILEIK